MYTKLALSLNLILASGSAMAVEQVAEHEKDFVWYCESDEATEAQKITVEEVFLSFKLDREKVSCKDVPAAIEEDLLKSFRPGWRRLDDLSPLKGLDAIAHLICKSCSQEGFDSIPTMPNLWWLDMKNSRFEIFHGGKRFPEVTKLSLEETTVKTLQDLKGLVKLEEINFNSSKVTNLKALADLPKLKAIEVADLEPEALYTIPYLPTLKDIYAPEIGLTSITFVENVPNLEVLWVHMNEIKSIRPIENLHALKSLTVGYNQITDISPISSIKNYAFLEMGGNLIKDYSAIKNIDKVARLEITASPFKDWQQIEHLQPSIESLFLLESEIAEKHIPVGSKDSWPKLQELNLERTKVKSLEFMKRFDAPLLKKFEGPTIENKTEENCPTSGVPEPVAKFCSDAN